MFRGEVYELITDEEDAGKTEESPTGNTEEAGDTADQWAHTVLLQGKKILETNIRPGTKLTDMICQR